MYRFDSHKGVSSLMVYTPFFYERMCELIVCEKLLCFMFCFMFCFFGSSADDNHDDDKCLYTNGKSKKEKEM